MIKTRVGARYTMLVYYLQNKKNRNFRLRNLMKNVFHLKFLPGARPSVAPRNLALAVESRSARNGCKRCKTVTGTPISHLERPNRNTGLPLQKFRSRGNFPVEWIKKSCSSLHTNRNFRKIFVNVKQPNRKSFHIHPWFTVLKMSDLLAVHLREFKDQCYIYNLHRNVKGPDLYFRLFPVSDCSFHQQASYLN